MLFSQRHVTVPLDGGGPQPSPQLGVVLEMSDRLAELGGLQEILDRGLETVCRRIGAEAGRIYLAEPGGDLVLAASRGIAVQGLERIPAGQGFSGRAAATRSFLAHRVEELDDAGRVELLTSRGLQSVVCLPLIALGEVVGVMNLGARRILELDQAEVQLLAVLGNLVAVAVMNARQAGELREQARQLESQKQALGFFAYTAAHDLKGPASAIAGLVRLLRKRADQGLDPRSREICGQIEKAAVVVEELASELNAYVRAREAELEPEEVDLAELVEQVRAQAAPEMERRGVRWSARLEAPRVRADRLALTRALSNLLDNALRYGGERLGRLEVGCRPEPGGWRLWVADDGVGVPEQERDKVFSVFGRGSSSRGLPGTGLGLAVVAETARRHGGRAWLEQSPGGGATVHLTLSGASGG
jgi:signal transduction histidine kinase